MKKRILLLLTALCLLLPTGAVAASAEGAQPSALTVRYDPSLQEATADAPEIGCRTAFVADPATGKVLYEKNAHTAVYPASTTKLLTALLVMENCDLDETATVSEEALRRVPSDYVDADLEVGERLSVRDLLYALLLPSANDAAFVLAEHVSGSSEAFVARMNERAAELGCEALHFVNPNGIHDPEHICTAYDLFLIARECRKHEVLCEIVKAKTHTLPATEQHPEADRTLLNSNEMLLPGSYYYAYCTGMKTGRTDAAGECLVATSTFDGMDLISVVLGGRIVDGVTERFTDTRTLLDYAYANYDVKTVASRGDVIATLRVGKATGDTARLDAVAGADITAVAPEGLDPAALTVDVTADETLTAPVAQDQVLGTVTYTVDGLVYTTDLIAAHPVEKPPYWLFNVLAVAVILATVALCVKLLRTAKGARGRKRARVLVAVVAGAEILLVAVLLIVGAARAATEITPASDRVHILSSNYSEQGD